MINVFFWWFLRRFIGIRGVKKGMRGYWVEVVDIGVGVGRDWFSGYLK